MTGSGFVSFSAIIFTVLGCALCIDSASAQNQTEGSWSLNQPGIVPEFQTGGGSPGSAITAQPLLAGADTTSAALQTPATAGNPPSTTSSQESSPTPPVDPFISGIARGAESLGVTKLSGSFVQTALLLGALGLAPAILLMTTCYIRIMVVFGLLRQALGTSQLPPTQVLMSLSIFLTILVMTPVWMEIKTKAFDPWNREENPIGWEQAWAEGNLPLKQFMAKQIEISGNRSAVEVLYRHGKVGSEALVPENLNSAPLNIILPAFILSELKVAFLLGFQIFLPFLVLDLVVSTVTVSMGLNMLSPTMVSLPLKLILFVMVDGWNLVVGMLLQSFGGG
jgi:flagellar biosynthetic protein FliP